MKTYISLFSCAGVGCYGFKQLGFECVASCELNEKRLDIQKINKKCKYDSGYICGDLTEEETKNKVFDQIKMWETEHHLSDIDVVVATPPCQGMSSINYKKNNEIHRNSLVVEAVSLIDKINPNYFIFENVRKFLNTLCIDEFDNIIEIESLILDRLGKKYNIFSQVINFKDYGVPSSRPRTIVIGTKKDLDFLSPLDIFPLPEKEISFKKACRGLSSLNNIGETTDDELHFFRPYPEYMREWITSLNEGESAFNNVESKRPYKIVNEQKVPLKSSHLGNKFRRLYWDRPASCVTTRNDQLAATDTIHPSDDRVLSIRELMRVMTIPKTFKWLRPGESVHKKEMLIRQCIGEAVPTKIMYKMAKKISDCIDVSEYLSREDINYKDKKLLCSDNIIGNRILAESNITSKDELSKFYTPADIVFNLLSQIDLKKTKTLKILEPSVGCGNFLFPMINFFIHKCDFLEIDCVDIDSTMITFLKKELAKMKIPKKKLKVNFFTQDFLNFDIKNKKYDYVIGNPPYKRISSKEINEITDNKFSTKNLYSIFIEKIFKETKNILFVIPKTFLNAHECSEIRKSLEQFNLLYVNDYDVNKFPGVFVETIALFLSLDRKRSTKIFKNGDLICLQQPGYVYHTNAWLLYRNKFFDSYIQTLVLDVFNCYRDRSIVNSMLVDYYTDTWVIRSKNIVDGDIKHIDKYDKYLKSNQKVKFPYRDEECIIMPNFTYNIRAAIKPKGVICNGSAVMLLPKIDMDIHNLDLSIYSSNDFKEYYSIVKNRSKFTLNIDKSAIYYIGVKKYEN